MSKSSEGSKIESGNISSVEKRNVLNLINIICDGIHSWTVKFDLDEFNERIVAGITSQNRKNQCDSIWIVNRIRYECNTDFHI